MKVAPNAILNAGGRADEVRCYPGTREEVIGKMEKWMDREDIRTSRMMWLSGPAGAGKSAILQTVSERCQERGRHVSNFFFFRGDGTRNHAQPLVATLVYQLRTLYATLDKPLEDCLQAMPLICKASIGEQFRKLISAPVHTVQGSSSICHPIILVVDGLDECEDKQEQEQILGALHALVDKDNSPFLVLIASRAEPHIVMTINKIASSVVSIFLDDEYRPQDDIRRFVTAKFDEIKGSHHLAHTLDKYWPSEFDIYRVVEKSSGQFIYAAIIMRFIQYSAASPSLSLLTVHGIRPAANHSPYTQLDSLYSYILSNSHNIGAVKLCFGLHFIWKIAYDQDLEHALQFEYLYFASDLALYKQMLQRWIRFAYRNNINDISIEDLVTGAIPLNNMRRDIHMYYHWYLLTEQVKHALTLYK
ncbi:hypothetical protein D9619_008289 [Psilocybe cf. subviscida]|uniref:NACHT domain-containing protein n=1 Tax=Psilocybe cf. subviscida TaxID=2480587 RepID=A0A8H5B9A6_9AGAR|nr:hypothetical protein D9619_008289 [Psilocybe cf. subviscida]